MNRFCSSCTDSGGRISLPVLGQYWRKFGCKPLPPRHSTVFYNRVGISNPPPIADLPYVAPLFPRTARACPSPVPASVPAINSEAL